MTLSRPMTASERDAVLARLTEFPARLARVAHVVADDDALAGGPPAREWTARENVAHLVAVERGIWRARLDQLAGSAPGVEPDWGWTEPGPTDDPSAATLEGALALFALERAATLARTSTYDEAGWARTGMHVRYGRLDVAALLRVAADHDDEHIVSMTASRPDA